MTFRDLIRAGVLGRDAAGIVLAVSEADLASEAYVLDVSTSLFQSDESNDDDTTAALELPAGLDPSASALARSAGRLNSDSMMGQVADHCIRSGVVWTWSEVVMPVLTAAGKGWSGSGHGVEVEHALSEAVIAALRAYLAFLPHPPAVRPILLASSSSDRHTPILHAMAAALTECHVPVRMLGGDVPVPALMSAASRTQARSIFLWRQTGGTRKHDHRLAAHARLEHVPPLFIGGPGWDGFQGQPPGVRVSSLAEGARLMGRAVT